MRIEEETNNTIVGSLTYTQTGHLGTVIAQTDVGFQAKPSIQRDLWLILIGAMSGILGGVIAEAMSGWFSHRQQVNQQVEKALGVLIPGIDVCIRAVKGNYDPPIELWEEIYFKEGLYVALAERAQLRKKSQITKEIAQLYARLVEYKANKQIAERQKLATDLGAAQDILRELM